MTGIHKTIGSVPYTAKQLHFLRSPRQHPVECWEQPEDVQQPQPFLGSACCPQFSLDGHLHEVQLHECLSVFVL